MDQRLKQLLRIKCKEMGIPLMGVADVRCWENPPFQRWMPQEFFPHSIFPEALSVVVIGLPVQLPVLETSPSIYYREMYNVLNALLDQYSYRIAELLNNEGFSSIFVPRDGYGSIEVLLERPLAFFSHRHAAFCAGLGTFGVNNMILTPEYGPRVRFGSILTSAPLPADPLRDEELCTRCMRCVQMCPSSALSREDYPEGITDKTACASWSASLHRRHISPCGICIKVCPIGQDRVFYHREDPGIYEETRSESPYQHIWDHVRRYGGK
ncbi:MAG: 4Fe-4S binding protein [Methanoregulaceae archaeon]|jgi:epoxyqueuosine reductase QueG|nr:4Fe-4S binding protein [Methanoregulaceae archaeon]